MPRQRVLGLQQANRAAYATATGGGEWMANGRRSRGNSVVGERWPLFWAGCAAISIGVALHLPMLAMAHTMGNHLSGMPMDGWMYLGMALIGIGVPAAIFGALPKKRPDHRAGAGAAFEAPDETPLTRSHAAVLLVLTLGLIIDTMKPATLGFVLPGMRGEYSLAKSTVALLPFCWCLPLGSSSTL